ncbi:glycerophosphodiester phosphodiesterase family protein [Xanthomonas phaseoli pv. dieffenbachiae]|uniref:Glycerophosphodiester phosphodiesterase n=2 Tax=Xanthomonas TaxID=338 RepID=A0A1V9HBE4_9XANT|nr:glycerophosphodiester phosphodiesterase family protein [Xanthomonas phaseoli pv. dieffenbachiae]MBO9777233.1 glycerophosphodiester phosphodiesterase family protein [Xanthomonas phaseoli pv. dieffenbachiae]MBO9782217.1 glycerophosphodiester phosphodiesterase family protein [Xanthomonas phaseoli pv. dieffenbachiae]MBO9790168.1 glycerophosphodiester phosphodiesterase family protein [Xanthomonas phaseoli pv. dieffenbachiae]MBO9798350.1 glycerophosphodiester phosphodiesterase family protein [Xant
MVAVLTLLLPTFHVAASTPAKLTLSERLRDPNAGTIVVSHRACWMLAAENTLAGINACVARGIDMVEIDIRTTRDGQLVLMHDDSVDRTTNGHGAVTDLTAAQIARMRIRTKGGGPDASLTEWHPPTFAQALAVARGKTLINLDVKDASLSQVMDAVEAANAQRDVLLNVPIGVPSEIVERAHRSDIALQVLYIERDTKIAAAEAFQRAATLRPTSLQLMFDDASLIETARHVSKGKIRLFVNTMTNDIASGHPMNLSGDYTDSKALRDPAKIWGVLRDRGVSMMQTDQPFALQSYLQYGRRIL